MKSGDDGARMYVSLLRGVNVGGHNKIKMVELAGELKALGFDQVQWYIQSGNIVFEAQGEDDTAELELKIEAQIASRFGLNVPAMVITADDFRRAVADIPFADEELEKSVLVFLGSAAAEEWAQASFDLAVGDERCVLRDEVVYMYCPDGLGRSKVANALLATPPRGVKATMRNWRTVNRILEMLN